MKKIALQADIKKAFFTIAVNEEDLEVLEVCVAKRRRIDDNVQIDPFAVRCEIAHHSS